MNDRSRPIPTTQGFLNPSLIFSRDVDGNAPANASIDLLDEVLSNDVFLMNVFLSCSQPGVLSVLVGSTLLTEMRTGPGCPNVSFFWAPHRKISAGSQLIIRFELNQNKAGAKVFASINGIKE